jgi:hypothetical protein
VGGRDEEVVVLMVGEEVVDVIDGVCTGEASDIDSGDDVSIISVAVETDENSDVVVVTVLEIVSSA